MTRFLLIRHGHTDAIGSFLAGRMDGVPLSARGCDEVQQLTHGLAGIPIAGVFSSPLERTRQTAVMLTDCLNAPVEIVEAINEFDFGTWTGQTMEQLNADPQWQRFNRVRSAARAPSGESMLDVQARSTRFLEVVAARNADAIVAIISHCDVIRAILCCYLGMSLDLFLRISIDTASVSVLELADGNPRVLAMNGRPSEVLEPYPR